MKRAILVNTDLSPSFYTVAQNIAKITGDQIDTMDTTIKYDMIILVCFSAYFWRVRRKQQQAYIKAMYVYEFDETPVGYSTSGLKWVDEVFVPAQFLQKHVPRSIWIPHNVYRLEPEDSGFQRQQFTFYTIGLWDKPDMPRKKIDLVLEAFRGLDAQLYVKTTSNAPDVNDPNIIIDKRNLTQRQIHDLHHKCDCFVTMSQGEGVGLPACEAIMHGNVVISTPTAGAKEYLKHVRWVAFNDVQGLRQQMKDVLQTKERADARSIAHLEHLNRIAEDRIRQL